MVMELIFRSLFWIGVTSLVTSLFLDFTVHLDYFVLAFGAGLIFIVYSLWEQYLWKRALKLSIPQQPLTPQPIANRMPSLQEPKPLSAQPLLRPVQLKRPSVFSHLFAPLTNIFHRKPAQQLKPLPKQPALASLEEVKKLFAEDFSKQPQRAATPFPFQPVQQFKPLQAATKKPTFEDEEHYVPLGAETLPHDPFNRYDEREEIASSIDERYRQPSPPASSQQPPLQPRSVQVQHHILSLFSLLLWLGLLLMGVSLFIPYKTYLGLLLICLVLSILLLASSVYVLRHPKQHQQKQPLPSQPIASQQAIANRMPSLQEPKPLPTKSLLQSVQPQKPASIIQQLTALPVVNKKLPPPQPSVKVIIQQPQPSQQLSDAEQLALLTKYAADSLKAKYPAEAIRQAARSAGWPETLIEKALPQQQKNVNKKKIIITLLVLVALLLLVLYFSSAQDMFLLPYWIKLLGNGSPSFYIVMISVFLIVIVLFLKKANSLYKGKRIRYRIAEQEHVAAIKEELQKTPVIIRGTYETDFDKLYHLLSERKKLTVSEVAEGFNVSKREAEEWGKILKEQGLIELHYPPVGDVELQWKK